MTETCFECAYENKDGICRKTKEECEEDRCNLWEKCPECKNFSFCHYDIE